MSVLRRGVRAGFALPSAIITLVLLSTLVVGVLFVATEELRAGRSDVADQRALALAEWAAEQAIAEWPVTYNTSLVPGMSAVLATALSGGDRVDVIATRTQPHLVWLTARAAARDGRALPARRAIGASLRLSGPSVPRDAALMAGGAVTVRDGGVVDGRDPAPVAPVAGLCSDAPRDVAGVMAPDSTRVCGTACTGEPPPSVTGSPAVIIAPALATDSAFFTRFGDEAYADLGARATIVFDGGRVAARPLLSAGTCDVADPTNWGDPGGTTACAHHYPIVFSRASVVLAAGSVGQGVLLVNGSLEVEPGARFVGVVIVTDDITVRGLGAEIVGVALARDANATGASSVLDGGAIRYASCAVRLATLGASRLGRTRERWWSELR